MEEYTHAVHNSSKRGGHFKLLSPSVLVRVIEPLVATPALMVTTSADPSEIVTLSIVNPSTTVEVGKDHLINLSPLTRHASNIHTHSKILALTHTQAVAIQRTLLG